MDLPDTSIFLRALVLPVTAREPNPKHRGDSARALTAVQPQALHIVLLAPGAVLAGLVVPQAVVVEYTVPVAAYTRRAAAWVWRGDMLPPLAVEWEVALAQVLAPDDASYRD